MGYSISQAITGYSYYYRIEFTNTGPNTITNCPLQLPINTSGLVSGGFVQADGDDFMGQDGSTQENVMITTMDSTGAPVRFPHTTINGDSTRVKELYFGNASATRDQWWIGSGSDTSTASDHADLDVNDDFMLKATIYPITAPGTEQPIIRKTGAYELVLAGSGSTAIVIFRVWQGGSSDECQITVSKNLSTTIRAWYDGGSGHLTSGLYQESFSLPGTITTNASDLEVCEFDGRCNDVSISTP